MTSQPSQSQGQPPGQPTGPEQTSSQQPPPSLKSYITSDMVATTMFNMRLITIVCTFLYFLSTLGLFGVEFAQSCYLNAFLTAFFTFSIRLYQRKAQQGIRLFSKEMYILASTEDSGHYMFYTFYYYNQSPMSIYLLPPFLYAVMFTVTYTNGLIPFLPASLQRTLTRLNDWIAQKQQDMRRYIAYAEIFMMFVVVTNVFNGFMFILAPLLHYYFLKWRYQSLRNPSVRVAFSDFRVAIDYLARHPRCPPFVSTILFKIVSFVCSLAPSQHMRREA